MKIYRSLAFASLLVSAPLIAGCTIEDDELDPTEEVGTSDAALSVFQWSAPSNVTTTTSDGPVGLGSYGGNVHLVHRGGSGENLYHTVYNGTTWSSTSQVPNQSSKSRPALEAYPASGRGSLLHMVHQGSSTDDLWWSTYNGVGWTPNSNIGKQSSRPPVLLTFGGLLHLYGTQGDCLYEATYNDALSWSANSVPGICGIKGMDVAFYDGTPILVTREGDNNLKMRRKQNNVWSAATTIVGQKSQSAPELSVWGGVLHMTHLGDTSHSVWWSTFDGTSWTTNNSIPSHTSIGPTSMAPMNSKLVQVYPQYCTTSACAGLLKFSTFQ